MKQNYLIVLLFFAGLFMTYSQSITVKGIVKDNNGIPTPGVNILVKNTKIVFVTGIDGDFQGKAEVGNTLVISSIGFETKEVKVTGPSLTIVLNESSQMLNEVTVTGALGITRAKSSLGYSTQSISGADIADTQRENFVNSMQGRIAGLTVTSTSGSPGSSASVQLRGVNSMSGNNSPLFVVDGLPINNSTLDQGLLISNGPNRDTDYTNRGADINPEDIESVTVLKGPEAAALYGIDAGNGAIIITTKKGKNGKGTLTYSTDLRLDEVYRFPDTQRVYQRGSNGISEDNYRRAFGEAYAPGTVLYDNIDNFFQTGVKQMNSLTFDAGSETATYRLSMANLSQTGVVPNSEYNRLNLALSGTAKISSKLKAEASFSYIKSDNDKASKGAGGFLLNLLTFPANEDVRNYLNADGTRRTITDGTLDTEIDNPLFEVNKNRSNDKNSRMLSNVSLTYDPLSWLNFTGRFGIDANSTRGYKSVHPESARSATGIGSGTGISTGGYFEQYVDQTTNYNFLGFATAKKSIGKFNGLLRLGLARTDNNYTILSTKGEKFFQTNEMNINNTDQLTQRSQERIIPRRVDGVFGEFTLDYDKVVTLSLTGRNDVSSTLPRANNSFFYPSSSLSFVFTELNALKGGNFLSYGKLRASYAQVANDAKPLSIIPSYEVKATTGGGFGYSVTGANSNLKAERVNSTEFGTELRFFRNKLSLDVNVYQKRTDDLIINNMRLSYGTGYVLSAFNFGSVQNRGLEITLTAAPIKTKDFSWDVLFNFTKTDSELLSLPSTLPEYYTSDTWLYGNVRGGTRVGSPLTTFTGYTNLKNDNGDILINPLNGQPLRDQTFPIVGDRNPDFMIGFQNSFTYKNFKLSFLLDIRKGGDVYNGTAAYLTAVGYSTKTLDREQPLVLDGVLQDGLENSATPTKNNILVTPYYQNELYTANSVDSDFIERDINWLRFRDITLNYRMPSEVLSKTRLFTSLSMYITITDAFMITNYTGADPAVNGLNASSGGAGGTGFDYGVLSTPRGFNIGFRFGL
ncbi:SusC/RagA family TonB-linked outer membrane protein [Flavobacterium algicola]|uniref:SusC/RagA family TonB-linked outer membrane protein n=1 Tax=Flavobacterium algicola TaxID=556529 RepID=UPI001EFEE0B5|nr:SusC/RagA family TonB-linked outer membrane protein [Flavobacterium algicola]MCG9791833.1 SusC/RagA family TonB-linked outer membrane protein [Flavobacterium algicola]